MPEMQEAQNYSDDCGNADERRGNDKHAPIITDENNL